MAFKRMSLAHTTLAPNLICARSNLGSNMRATRPGGVSAPHIRIHGTRRPLTRERPEGARMSGRFYALKPASLGAIARKPARDDRGGLLHRLRAAYDAWRRDGREHAALVALSERQLLDVGLTRSEVAAAHDRVFWRV